MIDKEHIVPGDSVALKNKKLKNAPVMQVKNILRVPRADRNDGSTKLVGLECFWFDANQNYQQGVFNTKDLEKI